jgi:hypothetical protein
MSAMPDNTFADPEQLIADLLQLRSEIDTRIERAA